MKNLKNTSVSVIEKGIETSNRFENNILAIFKENASWINVNIKHIALWDVSFGNTGYGRFRRAGRGIELIIEGERPSNTIDGDIDEFEETFNLSETIESYDIDALNDLEYGTTTYSNEMKRITLKLVEDEIDNIIETLNEE